MGVDYSAYAVVGLDVDEMEGTDFYADFYRMHEDETEYDIQYELEKKYGISIYYFDYPYSGNWEACTVGYNVGNDTAEEVQEAFNKFKMKFGLDARLQGALQIW